MSTPLGGRHEGRVRAHARRLVLLAALLLGLLASVAAPALALDAVEIDRDQEQLDLTTRGELYKNRGDRLQIEMAPGADGVAGRMVVPAITPGTDPEWFVFALRNTSPERLIRWLTADRYSLVGSQVFWPDLDSARVIDITPSLGFRPERIADDSADIFRLTIEPGQTITFAAELTKERKPALHLWDPDAYQNRSQDRMLFFGVLLGITGLLAIFMTSIYAANHKAIFPTAALVAWCALAYFCIDFGFGNKLFKITPERTALYRASAEAALAFSLVLFLYTFLRIRLWHGWIRLLFFIWILMQAALIPLAAIDASFAAGLARSSTLALAGVGTALILYLSIRGQERALSLVPVWLLLLVWLFGAAMVVLGNLSGDLILSGLVAGLVVILVLLGFTVTQYAFRNGAQPALGSLPSQAAMKSLAVDNSGAATWEWMPGRDEVSVSSEVEEALGLDPGALVVPIDGFLQHVHPSDRERFRMMLTAVEEQRGGDVNIDFRMRRQDASHLWYELRARAEPADTARGLRCIGLMRDVTAPRRAHERLMHDAVHDSLTGLPNRELFFDRLNGALTRFREGQGTRPTVLYIDIDRFKNVNKSLGIMAGDSMLLTLARRLSRHLNPQDTLARIGGDQFAILMISDTDARQIAMLAERVRQSLRTPMKIGAKEIVLTASIGVVVAESTDRTAQDLLREAEIAMIRARRLGPDRIEIFKPEMRSEEEASLPLESELRRAIERGEISVLYQPITRLAQSQIAGFEALLRWDHPKHGRLAADDFIPMAEETGLIGELGSYVLGQALEQAAIWQQILPRTRDPVFVSVNVSSRQLFRQDLAQEIRLALARESVPPGTLRLEVTESLVMENPERAIEILTWLKTFGAGLALDDFGTGYSSLSYLHRFPFDVIKVDKSLVHDSGQNGASGSAPVILRSVVALAHELGKAVVAEGVESADEAAFLRSIGCEYAQGYYYGEPVPAEDVTALLKALAESKAKRAKRKQQAARPRPKEAPITEVFGPHPMPEPKGAG